MKISAWFSLLVLIALWQLGISLAHLPTYLAPGPVLVLHALWQNKDLLLQESLITFGEALAGLLIAAILGVGAAFLLHLSRWLRAVLLPLILISQAIPMLALAPLIILWAGYGLSSKLIIVFLTLFFPITASTYDGFKHTPAIWHDQAFLMTSHRYRKCFLIEWPYALPSFASGFKIATAWAPLAAVVSEWVGSSEGLGFLLQTAQSRLDTPLMFAAIVILIVFSLVLYALVAKLLKKTIFWH